eukprot:6037492-Prymnesium_polylepis.1
MTDTPGVSRGADKDAQWLSGRATKRGLLARIAALAPHAHAHHVCLEILHVYDAPVTLRSPRHAHGHDTGAAGGLADRDDLARKS